MKKTLRPNILLITTDQQRGDCLRIEDHPILQTPNLGALGREGTHFRRGYSECPFRKCYAYEGSAHVPFLTQALASGEFPSAICR